VALRAAPPLTEKGGINMIIKVYDGTFMRQRKTHLFNNLDRESAFCGYTVKNWQSPWLSLEVFDEEADGKRSTICKTCLRKYYNARETMV